MITRKKAYETIIKEHGTFIEKQVQNKPLKANEKNFNNYKENTFENTS